MIGQPEDQCGVSATAEALAQEARPYLSWIYMGDQQDEDKEIEDIEFLVADGTIETLPEEFYYWEETRWRQQF